MECPPQKMSIALWLFLSESLVNIKVLLKKRLLRYYQHWEDRLYSTNHFVFRETFVNHPINVSPPWVSNLLHEHLDHPHQRHSNQLERIERDYDNGWKLEDGEVITLINRWIPNPHSAQLSDHMGFRLFIRLIIWTDIYIAPLLVFYMDCVPGFGICTPSLIGPFSRNRNDCHASLIRRKCVFWRGDYLNREKLVTLFKHLRGIFSLKKFLEVFLAEPPVSSLAWEHELESEESEESLSSLFPKTCLPHSFLTRIRS